MDTREADSEEVERQGQMSDLRKNLIPRTVTLLHTLLHRYVKYFLPNLVLIFFYHSTGQFQKCISLADLVASDQHAIYTAFSRQDVKELLSKIRESSLAVMDQGKDPWGFSKQ